MSAGVVNVNACCCRRTCAATHRQSLYRSLKSMRRMQSSGTLIAPGIPIESRLIPLRCSPSCSETVRNGNHRHFTCSNKDSGRAHCTGPNTDHLCVHTAAGAYSIRAGHRAHKVAAVNFPSSPWLARLLCTSCHSGCNAMQTLEGRCRNPATRAAHAAITAIMTWGRSFAILEVRHASLKKAS